MVKTNLSKICLNCIVKNEANVIERMLKTTIGLIDYYVIVDTGSTDGTQDIIKNFYDKHNIKGKIINHEWVNFGNARNKAIAEAKLFKEENNIDKMWCCWIDADEQFIKTDKFDVNILKTSINNCKSANIYVHYGSMLYFRKQFFNLKYDWEWIGPLHEVLVLKNEKDSVYVIDSNLTTFVSKDGSSWTSTSIEEKYSNHAKIFEDYCSIPEQREARWVFYMAQSYRDAGTSYIKSEDPEEDKLRLERSKHNIEQSIKYYTERTKMSDGFWEEIYYSYLMIAQLKARLTYNLYEVINAYLDCGKTNPERVEHLMPIILYYQQIKDYETAYIYSLRANQVDGQLPKKSSLFLDPDLYLWKVYDVHSLNCYYTNRKAESITTFRKLLKQVSNGKVPESQISRINDNKKYFN